MDKQFLKSVGMYIFTALLSVILIAYIVYSAFGGVSSAIETLTATVTNDRDTVSFDAYIMRSETIIYSSVDGGVNYLVDDGDKVGYGAALADIYADGGSLANRNEIIELDREISVLESSNIAENILVSDTAAIDSQINSLYSTLVYRITTGDIDYALRKKDELLTLLNKRRIIVRDVADYNDRITLLENKKLSLSASSDNIVETVASPGSGYFYSEIDGYEDVFSSARVGNITLSDFEDMTESPPRDYTYLASRGYSVGKLMNSYVWYMACETTSDMLRYFRDGSSYTAIFPYSNDVEISMTLYRIITDPDSDKIVLIFRSGYLPETSISCGVRLLRLCGRRIPAIEFLYLRSE